MKAKVFNIQKFSLHDGAGIRTSVFFCGCNLHCQWCANPECNAPHSEIGKAVAYDLEELLLEVMKDEVFYARSGGGVTLTGGEIFLQYEFIRAFCLLLKSKGVHITIETSGAADPQKFREIAGLVDFVYIDCKHYDEQKHIDGTGISCAGIRQNMKWLAQSTTPYCVRIPVIPMYNDSDSDAKFFGEYLSALGCKTVELLPFHQFGEEKYKKLALNYPYSGVEQLHKEDLLEYAEQLRSFGLDVIVE